MDIVILGTLAVVGIVALILTPFYLKRKNSATGDIKRITKYDAIALLIAVLAALAFQSGKVFGVFIGIYLIIKVSRPYLIDLFKTAPRKNESGDNNKN